MTKMMCWVTNHISTKRKNSPATRLNRVGNVHKIRSFGERRLSRANG